MTSRGTFIVHLTRAHLVTSRSSRAVDHDTIPTALSLVTLMEGVTTYPTPTQRAERIDVCHVTSGRLHEYMCIITHSPRIGSESVGSRCCCGSQGPLCVSFGGVTPMTQTTHAHRSTATAPCAHDLVGTACQVCGSESHVVSCRHVPTFPLSGTYDQSHTVRPSFPFPTSPQCCCFFYRKYAGTNIDSYLADSG